MIPSRTEASRELHFQIPSLSLCISLAAVLKKHTRPIRPAAADGTACRVTDRKVGPLALPFSCVLVCFDDVCPRGHRN